MVLLAHLALIVATAPGAVAGGSGAQDGDEPVAEPTDARVVDVVEVSGLLDSVLADFVASRIDQAEDDDVVALVLQLDSGGAVVDDAQLDELAERIETTDVPVHVWIGPPGARATGGTTRLVAAAARRCAADPTQSPCVGIAPRNSRVEATRELLDAAAAQDRAPDPGQVAVGDVVTAELAVESGLADSDAPAIGDFVVDLPGVETRVVDVGDTQQRTPVTPTRFAQLPLGGQILHTVASPPVAYLLFVIGLALIVFELFTAGIGIAGVVGAGSLVLGAYGLAELPTRPVAVALLLFAAFGYAVDVQTSVPRVWTGIATAAFVAGSVLLYDGVTMSWIPLVVGIVGMTLAMLGGMPAMVRSRFSTPTIGREWMVGEHGAALDRVAPDGVVTIRDARWRAHTNRATPIEAGEAIRVVAIDGLVLEVEPEVGAAREHRG
jgi:membrane-bound serine protease (ClpP class)